MKIEIGIEGRKDDEGKLRYDLLPFDALEELAKVYTKGAEEYGDRNWEKGIKFSRIIAAIFRHITSWILGEGFDKKSELHHLAHAAWGCLAIVAFQIRGKNSFNNIQKDWLQLDGDAPRIRKASIVGSIKNE